MLGQMSFHLEDNEISFLPFNVTKSSSNWIVEMNSNSKKINQSIKLTQVNTGKFSKQVTENTRNK